MNIKDYLFKTLNDEKLLNTLTDKRVYFLHADNPQRPYLEYETISEYGVEFSEGTEKFTRYKIQVDIFSENSYSEIEEELKQIMKAAGFKRIQAVDLYEEKTKLYHKAIRYVIDLPND